MNTDGCWYAAPTPGRGGPVRALLINSRFSVSVLQRVWGTHSASKTPNQDAGDLTLLCRESKKWVKHA
jgi:hypothetical protein